MHTNRGSHVTRFHPGRPGVTSRLRLRKYDYSTPGDDFLTLCINDWSHRLGEISEDILIPSCAGDMVERIWLETPTRYPGASLDEYCVMPNHFHAIVGIGVEENMQSPFPAITTIYGLVQVNNDRRIHSGCQGVRLAIVHQTTVARRVL